MAVESTGIRRGAAIPPVAGIAYTKYLINTRAYSSLCAFHTAIGLLRGGETKVLGP